MTTAPHAVIHTDGSCDSTNGHGGWCAVVAIPAETRMLYGFATPTTISRCELLPIIEGVRMARAALGKGRPNLLFEIVSDSEYTIKTIDGLNMINKNKDLWAAYKTAVDGVRVIARWERRNTLEAMTICDTVAWSVRKFNVDAVTGAAGQFPLPSFDKILQDLRS